MLEEDAEALEELRRECEEEVGALRDTLQDTLASSLPESSAMAAAEALASAEARLEEAKEPVNFPVNFCFSSDGTGLTVDTLETWKQEAPADPIFKDDKKRFYQNASRAATFEEFKGRARFNKYVPIYRGFYAHDARIFLVRGEGELMVPARMLGQSPEASEANGDLDMNVQADDSTADMARAALKALRFRRGWEQGDVLATWGSMCPYQVSLNRAQKECRTTRIVADADDTMYGGPNAGADIDKIWRIVGEDCDAESTLDKVRGLCPLGGTEGIPDWILENQEGEIHGLICVGAVFCADTEKGRAFGFEELSRILTERLAPLDEIDLMRDEVDETDCTQIRYGYLSRCANQLVSYWQRIQRPSVSEEVMRNVVDPRLRRSLELLARADASDAEQRERFTAESSLPTAMGGVRVGGAERLCKAQYVGGVFKRLPKLAATCSLLFDKSLTEIADLGMYDEFREAYELLQVQRDSVASSYEEMDDIKYYTVRGGCYDGLFHPKKLPKALAPLAEILDPKSNTRPPSSKALSMVDHSRQWLSCLSAAKKADAKDTGDVRHREASRFIAVSQYGAGAPFEMSPDGTFGTTIASPEFEIIIERHGGLNIATAKTLHDALDAISATAVDRRGDDLSNAGEHNRRHHAVVRKAQQMVTAVAVGQVVLGDKEDKAKTDMLNEGCVVDLAELEGDDATGGDCLYEVKVPSAMTKSFSAGKGSKKKGGKPASVGHLHAFGNTEEFYRRDILGCRRRGRRGEHAFVHKTGKGYVEAHVGTYHDALFAKKTRVVPLIVETTGGIAPHALAHIGHLARRAKGRAASARDGTKYGRSRTSTRSYYVHHTQRIACAAQQYDARGIRKNIAFEKHQLMKGHTGAP